MAKKAELKATLSLATSPFMAAANRVKSYTSTLGKNLKGFITAPLAAASAAIAGFLTYQTFKAGIDGSIKLGSEMFHLSRRTGMSVGGLMMLKKVATETGTEFEPVIMAIGKMQRQLVLAEKGGASAGAVFRFLGLSVNEIARQSPTEQFQAIGKAIAGLPNPAMRAAMAMQIFGRAGTQLLPLFDEIGNADFGNLSEKAKAIERNAELFHHVTIAFRKAQSNLSNVFIGIAERVAPQMLSAAEAFGKVNFLAIGNQLGDIVSNLMPLASVVFSVFGKIAKIALMVEGMFANIIKNMTFFVVGLGSMVADIFTTIGEEFGKLMKDAAGIVGGVFGPMIEKLKPFFGVVADMFGAIGGKIKGAVDAVINRGKKVLNPAKDKSSDSSDENAPWWKNWSHSRLAGSGIIGASNAHSQAVWRLLFAQNNPASDGMEGHFYRGLHGLSSIRPYSQRGGLGSMGKLNNSEFSMISEQNQAFMLLSLNERRAIENRKRARGEGEEDGASAFNSIRAGDARRRRDFLKEQLKGKMGIDKSNELLEAIRGNTETTADAMEPVGA